MPKPQHSTKVAFWQFTCNLIHNFEQLLLFCCVPTLTPQNAHFIRIKFEAAPFQSPFTDLMPLLELRHVQSDETLQET